MAIAAACATAIVFVQAAAPGQTVQRLLPDAHPAAPFEATIVTKRRGGADRFLLAFPSITENIGDGPLEIVATRPNRRRRTMRAAQLVERTDGSKVRYGGVGTLRYERNPDHSHWHYMKFMVYELRRASDNMLVGPDAKTGFCLGDRHPIDDRRIRGAATDPQFFVNCGKSKPRLLRVREGISVGWYDNYESFLEGQYIDVTDVPAGRYVLVHRSNPFREVRETKYSNNASSALIDLARSGDARPSVEILKRCSSKPRCG